MNEPGWCRQRAETYLLTDTGGCEEHTLVFLAFLNAPSKTPSVPERSWLFQMLWRPRSGPFKSLVIVCAPGEIEGQMLIWRCPKRHLHNISFPATCPRNTTLHAIRSVKLLHSWSVRGEEWMRRAVVLLFDLGGFCLLRSAEEETASFPPKKQRNNED